MAQTEITVQIFEDIKTVTDKLEQLGYTWYNKFTGRDQYFTTLPKSEIDKATYKDLLDSSIILREYEQAKDNSYQSIMLHKKKTIDANGNVIGEQKNAVKIDSCDKAAQLLSTAGLINWTTLQQQNNFYKKGEVVIIAGNAVGLEGSFIEIEDYPSIQDKPEEEKFKILSDFVDELGMKKGSDYSCKKVYMLYTKNKENSQSK